MSTMSHAPFALPERPLEAEIVAKYFRGFGDPTRVRIMQLLREREHSVGSLPIRPSRFLPRLGALP